MRTIIRLILSALAFTTIMPLIPGVDFHGSFWTALALSVLFGIMLWLVELITLALAAIWTISSFGLALLWLIPLWIIGFWILPALALMLCSALLPQYFSIDGFLPAALAGLVMLVIGILTSKTIWKDKKNN